MKSKLENSIKQSLENFEAPYNAAAWESMRSKLDQKMPAASSGKSNYWKWFGAASVLATLVVSSYFLFNPEEKEPTQNNVATLIEKDSANEEAEIVTNNKMNTSESEEVTHTTAPVQDETETSEPAEINNDNAVAELPTNENVNRVDHVTPLLMNDGSLLTQASNQTEENDNGQETVAIILPSVNTVCAGESVNIKNDNDVALIVAGPELHVTIPAHSSGNVSTREGGIHTITAKNKSEQSTEFMVLDAPAAEFIVDEGTKFEKGLPTTKVESTVHGNSFTWNYDNYTVSGEKADVHFYEKGSHEITMTVVGNNGCKNRITKTIQVAEDYNLMAPDAFTPNSAVEVKRTFMPYALIERNVLFTMTIIDPKDGHTIFETRDANAGWDGTDIRNGQSVAYGSYLWNVVIESKAANEKKNKYIGEVVVTNASK